MKDELLRYNVIAEVIRCARSSQDTYTTTSQIAQQLQLKPAQIEDLLRAWFSKAPELSLAFFKKKNFLPGSTQQAEDLFSSEEARNPELKNIPEHQIILKQLHSSKSALSSSTITYEVIDSIYGEVLIASTLEGICLLEFIDSLKLPILEHLSKMFPTTKFLRGTNYFSTTALQVMGGIKTENKNLTLCVACTDFQFKVWQALLEIPSGSIRTYDQIAQTFNLKGGARAVGTAVGSNPIAILIPCHRVLRSDGGLGGYRWGLERKIALLAREQLV